VVALYRRYRPDTFEDVIGQEHVTGPLRQALSSDRTSHAYLFSGPRGCGKTTSARILARCLNCHEGPTGTPCGSCPSCVELSQDGGGSLDVVEIDAASHNGVDDARELRERAVFAPARDRYKIFILDEAHMVTQQGFNALLKIVEEPPPHVKFIFATTEPDKVLTTIRSRTHHYPFRLVARTNLVEYLERVLREEGLGVDEGVLGLVVRSGGGSVRDTLSLLDQLISGTAEKHISYELTQQLLGYTPHDMLVNMTKALSENSPHRVFELVAQVLNSGQNPKQFVEDLLSHLRDIIVFQATGGDLAELFPGVSEAETGLRRDLAQRFTPDELTELAESVSHTLGEMSRVTYPALHLEVLCAKLLSLRSANAGQYSPDNVGKEDQTTASENGDSPVEANPPATQDTTVPTPSSEEKHSESTPIIEDWNLDAVRELWPSVLHILAASKKSLWAAMTETHPESLDGDVLTIGFPRKSDADILKKPQGPGSPLPNADLLRDAILELSGHRVRFTVVEVSPMPGTDAASPTPPSDASWPVVSHGGNDESEIEGNDSSETAPVDARISDAEENGGISASAPLANRGEPVVRQLLGGELVGEEILDETSGHGELDV